ncbi:MAG TPA: YtxH domain-containing protein [Dehalococcoidia bacterium]|jgi:gas vesicle protein|nr:YtxH domain-containing protein [Dehalococcoidia bacterium]
MLKKSMMAAGIAFGAAIGGASGILLAPRSGRENRKVVKNKMEQMRNKVRKNNHAARHDELEESLASRKVDYLH